MATLYVGGLEPHTTESQLRELFGEFGEISGVRVVTNDAGECRGFAYVTYSSDLAAAKARVRLDGITRGDQILRVALAT